MKKLIFILSLFICFQSFGQIQNNSYYRGISSAVGPDNPGTTDMVFYYAIDESSGAVTYDSHNSFDGDVYGSPSVVGGFNSNCREYTDDATKYILSPQTSTLGIETSDLSISFWVKFDVVNNLDWIISNRFATSSNYYVWLFHIRKSTSGFLQTSTYKYGGATLASTSTSVSINTWYHIVYVIDRTARTITLYIDGTNIDETTYHSTYDGFSFPNIVAIGAFNGAYPAIAPAHPVNGLIDEVIVYKKVVTQDNATWLYDSGNGKFYNDLTAFLKPLYQQLLPLHFQQLEIGTPLRIAS